MLGRDIAGLNRVAKVLVKQRGALDQILDAGPLALNNLCADLQPEAGTLDTNANIGEPGQPDRLRPVGLLLCSILASERPHRERCASLVKQGLLPAGAPSAGRPADPSSTRPSAGLSVPDLRGAPAMSPARAAPAAAVVAGAWSGRWLLTGCDFDVFQLPLARGTDVDDDAIEVTVMTSPTSSTWCRSPR